MGSECNYTLCLRDLIKTKTEIKKKKHSPDSALWTISKLEKEEIKI